MEEINKRVQTIRNILKMTQHQFGESIGLSASAISTIENGERNVTAKHIKLLAAVFNVREEWLRTGKGEIFIPIESISLDEYAKSNDFSWLETEILKAYLSIPKEMRKIALKRLMEIFLQYQEKNKEDDELEEELERYRQELLAEKRGQKLSASEEQKGKSS